MKKLISAMMTASLAAGTFSAVPINSYAAETVYEFEDGIKKVTRIWTADKDILKESKLKEYKYGDQKNIFTLLSKNYIGYYDMNTAI